MLEEYFDPKIKIFDGRIQKLLAFYYFQVILPLNYQLKLFKKVIFSQKSYYFT